MQWMAGLQLGSGDLKCVLAGHAACTNLCWCVHTHVLHTL
jgi:hypothetical protein